MFVVEKGGDEINKLKENVTKLYFKIFSEPNFMCFWQKVKGEKKVCGKHFFPKTRRE